MSNASILFDPTTGSYGSIVGGALQVATPTNTSLVVKPVAISTATLSNVASSLTNVTILAANVNRLGAVIYNNSTTGVLYLKYGADASLTSFTHRISAGASMSITSVQLYTGIIDGFWSVSDGVARVTELT